MNVMKSDFYRIFRSGTFWLLLLITTICAVLLTVISHFIAAGTLGTEFIGTASGLMDNMIINIVGPVLIATFLCGDFQHKTIHDAILYGHGRKAIVWSKLIPFTVTIVIMLLPYTICTFIGFVTDASFSKDFANAIDSSYMMILANKADFTTNLATIGKLILALAVVSLMYVSRISVLFLLAYKIRKPIPIIGLGILIEMGLGIIAAVSSNSEIVQNIFSWTPFTTMRDNVTLAASVPDLLKSAATSIVFIAIVMNLTATMFHKAEVK